MHSQELTGRPLLSKAEGIMANESSRGANKADLEEAKAGAVRLALARKLARVYAIEAPMTA